jgi:hypothetical protein
MLLSAVSGLVVALPSSEVPEGLTITLYYPALIELVHTLISNNFMDFSHMWHRNYARKVLGHRSFGPYLSSVTPIFREAFIKDIVSYKLMST